MSDRCKHEPCSRWPCGHSNHLPRLQGHLGQGSCLPLSDIFCLSFVSVSSLGTTRVTFSPGSIGQLYSVDSDILSSTSHAHQEDLECTAHRSCGNEDEHEPAIRPPIWSILVYMLLVETLNIDDKALRQRFGPLEILIRCIDLRPVDLCTSQDHCTTGLSLICSIRFLMNLSNAFDDLFSHEIATLPPNRNV
jgi:hypothetical protein